MNDRIRAALEAMKKQEGGCLICDLPAGIIGVFCPDDSQKFGASKGKDRTLVYRICDDCHDSEGWMDRIEATLLERIRSSFPVIN
jgi:hypothetical protein